MVGLVEILKDLRALVSTMDTIPVFRLSDRLKESVKQFETQAHSLVTMVADGAEVEKAEYARLIGFGVRTKNALAETFWSFLAGGPKFFNDLISEIGSKSPKILAESRPEIDRRLELYKELLASDETDIVRLSELNRDIASFLTVLCEKADEGVRAEETRRSRVVERQRDRELAKEALAMFQ